MASALAGSPDQVPRRPILGVGVDAVGPDRAAAILLEAAREGRPLPATALAVHGLMTGWKEPAFGAVLDRLGLVLADGQPVRWALDWLFSAGLDQRVYGPQLMLDLCEAMAAERLSIFLYGSTEAVLEGLSGNLVERFPGLVIAGRLPSAFGPLDDERQREVAGRIRESGAALCFVGTGCPRQEVFALRMAGLAGIPMVAVGAAFDFHAGSSRIAPRWMQDAGLEWLFRLSREPARLWRRYLLLNPVFLVLLLAQKLGVPVGHRSATEPPDLTSIPG